MRNIAQQISEQRTSTLQLRMMLEHYCATYHCQGALCKKCQALLEFEEERTVNCIGCGDDEACSRQCYPAAIRLEINHVIRWAEPRLRWRKPLIIFRQLFQESQAYR